jgi:predicted DNA-binding protein with PD1-like motif
MSPRAIHGESAFVLVLDDGEEAIEAITRFAKEQRLGGASLTAIGASRSVVFQKPQALRKSGPSRNAAADNKCQRYS